MRTYFLIFIYFLVLVKTGHSFEIKQIDTGFLFGLFNRTANGLNTIKLRSLTQNSNSQDSKITIPAYFEEQCALECLKNINCIQYTFLVDQEKCVVSIRPNFNRQENLDPAKNAKIAETINCNLQTCSNGLYCSSNSNESSSTTGSCLCDSNLNNGQTCSNKIKYELSEWSVWSSCSASCNEG